MVSVISAGLSIVLATIMGSSGARKFLADAPTERLRRRLRLEPALWRATGGLEICAGIALLVGLSSRVVGVAAALGVTVVMVGAVVLHLRVRLTGPALVAPLVVLGVGVAAAVARLAVP